MKPKIMIELVEKKGDGKCHHGHSVGDCFEFGKDNGTMCPMAMHAIFPYIDILRYGGELPKGMHGDFRACCPDADVINVFRLSIQK